MTTQPHATLNLRSDGVKAWLNKNDISIESQESNQNKRLPPELQPKSNDSNSSDTKQTIIPPIYSHSRSRTDSQASFVTNHTDVTTSITSEVIISNSRFPKPYKKLPATLRKHYNKYRKSMSTDSTKIQSIQLVTPRSCSNTPSRDRALCGSLIQQSRRIHKYGGNHHNTQQHSLLSASNSKSTAKTPKTLDPIIQNSDIDDNESIQTKSKLTNHKNTTNTHHKHKHKQHIRKRSNSSLLSRSTHSKSTHTSYKSKQSKSIILTKNKKQKQFDASTFKVDEWLSSMDILQYKELFNRDGFDKLGAIVELNSDDLREMDIPKGHCKMILRQVHNLQNALNIKPLHTMHYRHRSNPDTISNHKSKAMHKASSHSTQSHSDPVIPTIDVILAFDDDDDDDAHASINKSCGFPDIDDRNMDLRKIYCTNANKRMDTGPSVDGDVDTADYHTFPRTSTNGSILPYNADIKRNKTPKTKAALQSLRVCIPPQISTSGAINVKQNVSQTSDTCSSSLPSFHPTNLNEEQKTPKCSNNDNNTDYAQYHLPQYHRYQAPQQAQRYIVYHPQQQPQNDVFYSDFVNRKRYKYREREYINRERERRYNEYFISDEEKGRHQRRHSISSTASNDYVLYEKGRNKNEKHQNKNNTKKRNKWLPSRVYKRKKASKSKAKTKHKQSKSGPLMDITTQRLIKTNSDKNKKEQRSKNKPWFLCGSSKNAQMNNVLSPSINTEIEPNAIKPPQLDLNDDDDDEDDEIETETKTIKSKSKTKTKSKSKSKSKLHKKHTITISTPHDVSYSRTDSHHFVSNITINNASGTITPYSSYNEESASRSYCHKTPEFIPRTTDVDGEVLNALSEAKELHTMGSLQCAAEKYAEFLHYFRNDVDARIRYALCLLDLGRYDLCGVQLDALIDSDPDNNSNNSMLRFVFGLLEHKRENYHKALQHYNAALLTGYMYPDRIYNNLASLFRTLHDYENAEKYQLLALQIDSANYVAYLNYAKILCDINRYDDATAAFTNAIALRPDLADVHVEFALFLMDLKEDYLLAATQLNTAHKLSPENSEIDELLKQAIEYCGNADSADSDDMDDMVDIEDIDDDKSDTIVLLSPEQSAEIGEEHIFNLMEPLQLNNDNDHRKRKESQPMNLPKPTDYTSSGMTGQPGYSPLKLAPIEKSLNSSKSTRKSICGSLPPPHNPLNPSDPIRRNSLMNMNRSQLSHLCVDNNDYDDTMSVMSDLSMLSDEEQT